MVAFVLLSFLVVVSAALGSGAKRPNIVVIMTDDQDMHHGSDKSQKALQELIAAEGTTFLNHYATTAVCCPSRVSFMRGQLAHNTNNTDISAPGGGFPKFVESGENEDYLPHWLSAAGYRTEYIGKLFNGNSFMNFSPGPKGWDHNDVLLEPYINAHNTVVMSANGGRPVWYRDFQQTDVLRIKALARLDELLQGDRKDPFFLMIAPTAPHVQALQTPPVPPSRYNESFYGVKAPRAPNFNPGDEFQKGKPAWLRDLPPLTQENQAEIDVLYRKRLQSLMAVDDVIEDVVEKLRRANALDNTYIIYTTDQGYHLGTHRHGAGKCLPYREDTNIPLYVRGPGIKRRAISYIPSTVTDFVPTFLDIAGVRPKKMPPLLDGSSLLPAWKNPRSRAESKKREAINVEFWASAYTELPSWKGGDYGEYFPGVYLNNTYKTMRIVGEKHSYLFSKWCTNHTELYDTKVDPYELTNIAASEEISVKRVLTRLNALLLVTKSCEAETCRNPWRLLQPGSKGDRKTTTNIKSLEDALNPAYDSHFASFPAVSISECLLYQSVDNEFPFYPQGSERGLGQAYRKDTGVFKEKTPNPVKRITGNLVPAGGQEQRHATIQELLQASRPLSDDELEYDPSQEPGRLTRREG